jgi:hypothetical protein
MPRPANRLLYLQTAANHARSALTRRGVEVPIDPLSCMSLFLRIVNKPVS